jgi:phage-related protein
MRRGADLAATYGGTTAEAVEAINAAVSRSEFDPLEKYGVSLNMTAVNAELAAKGQENLTGKQLDAAKKAIILEQIYGKTAKAAGTFARESDTAAGSQAIAAAQWENAAAALGEVLLPVATKVATVLASVGKYAQNNATAFQILAGVVLALSVAVLATNAALKVYAAATKIAAAVQWLWNAAMSANPIGLVVIAVLALVAAIVILWKRSETFRRIVLTVWNAARAGATAAARAISSAFGALWGRLKSGAAAIGAFVRRVWEGIRSAVSRVISAIRSLWGSLTSRLRSLATAMGAAVARAWDRIKAAVQAVIGRVGDVISKIRNVKVPDSIRNGFERVKNAVAFLIGKVADLISKIRGISLPGSVEAAFNRVKSAALAVVEAVKNIVQWIRNIPTPSINWPDPPNWLNKVMPGSFAASPVRSPMLGAGVGARTGAPGVPMGRTSSGAPIVINVTGALDPESVARQINRILAGHSRRVGLAT